MNNNSCPSRYYYNVVWDGESKYDFYKEVSEVLMVNSDNLSSELTGRRLRLEGISVRNINGFDNIHLYRPGSVPGSVRGKVIFTVNSRVNTV